MCCVYHWSNCRGCFFNTAIIAHNYSTFQETNISRGGQPMETLHGIHQCQKPSIEQCAFLKGPMGAVAVKIGAAARLIYGASISIGVLWPFSTIIESDTSAIFGCLCLCMNNDPIIATINFGKLPLTELLKKYFMMGGERRWGIMTCAMNGKLYHCWNRVS